MKHYIIIGAGSTGLSVGYHLSKHGNKVTIIDKNKRVGGVCSSFDHKDFILDIGPHKLYSQLDGIMPFFKEILAEDNLKVKKKNSLYLLGKCFSFPLKLKNLIMNISLKTVMNGIWMGFGAIPTFFKTTENSKNYTDYFTKGFGRPGYKILFEGYAKKVWGKPESISADLARKRVPVESIPKFISSMLSKKEKSKISADFFYYPKKGCVQVCENMAAEITRNMGEIILGEEVKGIEIKGNKANGVMVGKKIIKGDYVISTSHIDELGKFIKKNIPIEAYDASQRLEYTDVLLIFIFLNKKRLLKDNWIFYLQDDVVFNRVSEQKSFSKFTAPDDKTAICIDMTIPKNSALSKMSDEQIYKKVLKDLKKVKVIDDEKDIYDHLIRKEKKIYPIYDLQYRKNLDLTIKNVNSINGLLSIGRCGLFNYNNMDHCIDMGFTIGKYILEGKEKSHWDDMMKKFDAYRIVD